MSRASSRKPGGPSRASQPGQAGQALRVQHRPERLAALEREHQQILAKIRQKKGEQRRLAARIRDALTLLESELRPAMDALARLDREIHGLFAALLARRSQPRSVVSGIRRVYLLLQRSGALSPEPRKAAGGASPEDEEADEETDLRAAGGVTATRRADGSPDGPSLRGLFRRLAEVLHPDKAGPSVAEDEKEQRTEAMKELNRAYQDGDLARLIELERTWLPGAQLASAAKVTPPSSDEEFVRRCAALEQTIAGLRRQLDEIKQELKQLRRSPQAALLDELEEVARHRRQSPLAVWRTDLDDQAAQLRTIRDFVVAFRDGEIPLEEFVAGPPVSD